MGGSLGEYIDVSMVNNGAGCHFYRHFRFIFRPWPRHPDPSTETWQATGPLTSVHPIV